MVWNSTMMHPIGSSGKSIFRRKKPEVRLRVKNEILNILEKTDFIGDYSECIDFIVNLGILFSSVPKDEPKTYLLINSEFLCNMGFNSSVIKRTMERILRASPDIIAVSPFSLLGLVRYKGVFILNSITEIGRADLCLLLNINSILFIAGRLAGSRGETTLRLISHLFSELLKTRPDFLERFAEARLEEIKQAEVEFEKNPIPLVEKQAKVWEDTSVEMNRMKEELIRKNREIEDLEAENLTLAREKAAIASDYVTALQEKKELRIIARQNAPVKIDGEEETARTGISILSYNSTLDVYTINYSEKGGCGKSSITSNWKDASYNARQLGKDWKIIAVYVGGNHTHNQRRVLFQKYMTKLEGRTLRYKLRDEYTSITREVLLEAIGERNYIQIIDGQGVVIYLDKRLWQNLSDKERNEYETIAKNMKQ